MCDFFFLPQIIGFPSHWTPGNSSHVSSLYTYSYTWSIKVVTTFNKVINLRVLSHKLQCYTRIASPEKSRNNTHEKILHFFTCVWYRQSAADTALTFHTTWLGWWVHGKAFLTLKFKVICGNFFALWLLKHCKSLHCLQTVTFKLS